MIIHHYYIRNGRICDTIVWKHRRENRRKHQEKKGGWIVRNRYICRETGNGDCASKLVVCDDEACWGEKVRDLNGYTWEP